MSGCLFGGGDPQVSLTTPLAAELLLSLLEMRIENCEDKYCEWEVSGCLHNPRIAIE